MTKKGFKGTKVFKCKGCGERPDHMVNIDLNIAEGSLEDSYGSWECMRCHNINTTDAKETQYLSTLVHKSENIQ